MRKILFIASLFLSLASFGQFNPRAYLTAEYNGQTYVTGRDRGAVIPDAMLRTEAYWLNDSAAMRFISGTVVPLINPTSYVYATKIAGLNALVYVSPGLDTAQPVNLVLFTPGAGEQGTDITKLYIHGPFQYLKTGVDIKANLLVVAVQNVSANPRPSEYQGYIDGIKKLYKVNKIVLTGLSRGGQNAEWFANNSESNLSEIAGMVVFSSQGTVSDMASIPGTQSPALYLKHNIPIWRGLGDQDFTYSINLGLAQAMTAAAPKLGIWTIWPGAGHGDPVWKDGYNPFPVPTNPIYVTMKKSIYQWSDSLMTGGASVITVIPTVYKSAAESQPFTKSNCSCGIPTAVIYTVAAGKYTSTTSQAAADAFAMSDLTTNGPAYANTNGACTPVLVSRYEVDVMSDGTLKVIPLPLQP